MHHYRDIKIKTYTVIEDFSHIAHPYKTLGVSVAVCKSVGVCVEVYSVLISTKLAKQVIQELATNSPFMRLSFC